MKKLNRKNPQLDLEYFEKIFQTYFHPFEKGGTAKVYKFTILKPVSVRLQDLIHGTDPETYFKSGSYVLKILKKPGRFDLYNDLNHPFYTSKENCIKKLIALSDLKLIPKIYIINDYFIIMEYIDGILLSESSIRHESIVIRKMVFSKLEDLVYKFFENGWYIGDLHSDNIILAKHWSIYIIDPACNNDKSNKELDLESLEDLKRFNFGLK